MADEDEVWAGSAWGEEGETRCVKVPLDARIVLWPGVLRKWGVLDLWDVFFFFFFKLFTLALKL